MVLTNFVPLDKMKKLHVAYMASKKEPSLIAMSNEDVLAQAEADEFTANNKRPKESGIIYFQMVPKTLLDPGIHTYPPYQQAQEKLFRHIIQYRNQSVWKE